MRVLWQVFALLCMLQVTFVAQAATQKIVVSIEPLAALTRPLLQSSAQFQVLVRPGQEPHTFQLKPSQMLALHRSDWVLGVGTEADLWLQKALKQMPQKPAIWMRQIPGVIQYPVREAHLAESGDQHHKSNFIDPHIWLSPHNAQLWVQTVGQQWQLPQETVNAWQAKLQQADQEVAAALKPVQSVPFIVLHDAFQYFERHYGLNNVGVIQLNESVNPSMRQILKIRKLIQQKGVKCIVKEPEFSARKLRAVTQGLSVHVVAIDPLDSQQLPYDQFLRQLGQAFKKCLQ